MITRKLPIQQYSCYNLIYEYISDEIHLGMNSNTSTSLFPILSFHCTFRLVVSDFLEIPPLRGGNNEWESLSSSPLAWSSIFWASKEATGLFTQPLPSLASASINRYALLPDRSAVRTDRINIFQPEIQKNLGLEIT